VRLTGTSDFALRRLALAACVSGARLPAVADLGGAGDARLFEAALMMTTTFQVWYAQKRGCTPGSAASLLGVWMLPKVLGGSGCVREYSRCGEHG
jgi:hypothetical protein